VGMGRLRIYDYKIRSSVEPLPYGRSASTTLRERKKKGYRGCYYMKYGGVQTTLRERKKKGCKR